MNSITTLYSAIIIPFTTHLPTLSFIGNSDTTSVVVPQNNNNLFTVFLEFMAW
jgi:hypothetical protein